MTPSIDIARAHAKGLRGVLLWRMGGSQAQAEAMATLKDAVAIYMNPIYFDDQKLGLNADVRDLVVATYLDAIFQLKGERPMEALAPAEWVKSSSVQGAIADVAARAATKDPVLADLVRKDQDLKNEIIPLQNKAALEIDSSVSLRINGLNILRAEVQSQIKLKFPEYDNLVTSTPPDLAVAAKALADDEVFILLLPTDDNVFVWSVTRDGNNAAARVTLPRAQLSKLVKDLRSTLDFSEMRGGLTPFNKDAAYALYRDLLAPIQSSLEGKRHYIVAAGGVLGQIPFGVLLTGSAQTVDSTAPWLISRAAISHVPSLNAWLAVKQFAKSTTAPEPLMAWGDPQFASIGQAVSLDHATVRRIALTRSKETFDPEIQTASAAFRYSDIPPLPETRGELLDIARALKADPDSDLLLGERATKLSVMRSSESGALVKKRVLVFATHGLVAGDLPNLTQPALALSMVGDATSEPLAALLTLEDVLGLKLNADWVVLSACNTAAADGKSEEALSGLARGFFYAGSRSMLVTHWAVETESAKLLTTKTMSNYISNSNERKAESLRQAMLTVMKNPVYSHPAYWAPYALVGDGGR